MQIWLLPDSGSQSDMFGNFDCLHTVGKLIEQIKTYESLWIFLFLSKQQTHGANSAYS